MAAYDMRRSIYEQFAGKQKRKQKLRACKSWAPQATEAHGLENLIVQPQDKECKPPGQPGVRLVSRQKRYLQLF